MKRALFAFGILIMAASAANAGGLVSKHASSVQLTVDAARDTSNKNWFYISVSPDLILILRMDTTAGTVSAGTITSGVYAPGTIAATQDTAGSAFSFSQSYTQG